MLSPKDPAETITISFDFSKLSASATNATVTAAVVKGTDASPAAILSGSPAVTGAVVSQKITGGLAGVTYHLRCRVDGDGGNRYVIAEDLRVEAF